MDFLDPDGTDKDTRYRTFYLDELTFKQFGLDDEKVIKNLSGKKLEFEFQARIMRKYNTTTQAWTTKDKYYLTKILNFPKI